MAKITGKNAIFFVTSPRTPFKMIDEIKLLIKNYEGKKWNKETQTAFAKDLSKADFFEGKIVSNLDFAARDRINRAPKALGFVNLDPVIKLTDAGKLFIESKRPHEIFTRQLLKFQLPSPYHLDKSDKFKVKPYRELLKLIFELDGLSKDEISIFVMQLTSIAKYEKIKNKIVAFRKKVKTIDRSVTSYKRIISQVFENELKKLFKEDISSGNIATRESKDGSIAKFILTKKGNHRDYADAAIRYLRATTLITFHPKTYKVYVPEEKISEVKFILSNVPQWPKHFRNIKEFKKYLFADEYPVLLNDNKDEIINSILGYNKKLSKESLLKKDTEKLKDIKDNFIAKKRDKNIENQVNKLQAYDAYGDIIQTFDDIEKRVAVDPSLIMEWNTWRALTMLDDGNIIGNFRFDENGMPLYAAPGNSPDITCKYKSFDIIVEVTISTGQKQYEMEGEPVSRHLGKYKATSKKDVYCIFIAPVLNEATLAHFFSLHKINVSYYGGMSKIIPMQLSDFKKMIEVANNSEKKPSADSIKKFLDYISELALKTHNEKDWYQNISDYVLTWV
ncbi:MAG: AlwI family type II restriction endonuclease [Parcubacteria group bacterium]